MSSALVWRLASGLARTHPDGLWVQAEGGAMYDRVTLMDLAADPLTPLLTMNAVGTNPAFTRPGFLAAPCASTCGAGDLTASVPNRAVSAQPSLLPGNTKPLTMSMTRARSARR